MVNGYTFRGSNFVIFIVASHINWGHLINDRICPHRSEFFTSRVDWVWSGGAMVLGKLPVPGRPTNLDLSRARAS